MSWLDSIGVRGPDRTYRRIGNGQSNLTYLVTGHDGRRVVLRRPPLGAVAGPAHDVAREARIMTALQDTAIPVPEVIGVLEATGPDSATVVALSHLEGSTPDTTGIAELTDNACHRVGLEIVGALAELHALHPADVGLNDLGSSRPLAQRQLRRWTSVWERTRTRDLPALTELGRRIAAAAPEQTTTRLVHGDVHPANVLVDRTTGRMTALLDWELCTTGDPLADLGTLLAYWTDPGEEPFMPAPLAQRFATPRRTELVEAYVESTGRDVAALGFWHTLALWRIAIIAEGVVGRVRDDPRNRSETWTPSPATVNLVLERACAQADRSGL
ncbi:phosphotransferase family protein [Prauserella flavalba]|uniref:phosphotransferase family protein n=1 Tax=Prauserella flavalba TaxID=1477506 RepID=UPI0036E2DBE5